MINKKLCHACSGLGTASVFIPSIETNLKKEMSIKIIKGGLLSILVDKGRPGFRHLGIGPSGAMDSFAMTIANYLVGNEERAATLEMNFPAPEILFQETQLICVTGRGLKIYLDDELTSPWKPSVVKKGSILKFERAETGSRAYLSVHGGWKSEEWLGSFSTSLGVKAGGYSGRALQKDDVLEVNARGHLTSPAKSLPWEISKNELDKIYKHGEIRIIASVETDWLSQEAKGKLSSSAFRITPQSNRMGYRLEGEKLSLHQAIEMVSSPVDFGTVQLLPDGNLIILVADHQTTGGYPRIASVIKSDLPALAQMNPNDKIKFRLISQHEAEREWKAREKLLTELKQICMEQYKNYFNV